MLELRNVSFAYPRCPYVIRDISLTLERGATLGLMGENGSGKTTLASLMCGLLSPVEGDVLVDGFGTRDEASVHEIRRRVGIVFQDPDEQLVETTVEREIGFGLRNLGLEPSKVAVRVDRALAIFGIEHLRRRSCYLLSAGEKQLVAVASVFAMEPDYVLLDESTSLLDARARVGLVEAVERLIAETGAGLVFISMRLEDVWMCDRVAFLREGAVAFTSGKEDLAVRIAGLGLSLPGLAYMMNRLQGVVPDLGKRLAAGRSVSADSIYGALARLTSGTGGGADCP